MPGNVDSNSDFFYLLFSSYEPVRDRQTDWQTNGQNASCGLQDGRIILSAHIRVIIFIITLDYWIVYIFTLKIAFPRFGLQCRSGVRREGFSVQTPTVA